MKKLVMIICLYILACFVIVPASAQETDSVRYYGQQLSKLQRSVWDSLRKSEAYSTLVNNLYRQKLKNDNHGSFNVFAALYSADMKRLNESLLKDGFTPLSNNVVGFGLGFGSKNKNVLFALDFIGFSLTKKYTKGDTSIRSSFGTMWQFQWGYDLVPAQRVNIYPYIGFGLRTTTLSYHTPQQINPNYTNITDLLVSNRSVNSTTFNFGYQAGVGIDLLLGKENRPTGTILFLKAGTNRPVGKEVFKFDDVKLAPEIKYGQWMVSLGFKFFGR